MLFDADLLIFEPEAEMDGKVDDMAFADN